MNKYLKNINPLFRNKYFIAFTVFLIWIIFFDQNNLLDRVKGIRQLNKYENDKQYYKERIKNDSIKMNELKTNKENLEKFAREQYLMKKEDEDVFIIVEK